ncbi:MAG: hypothetical protein MRY32_01390 [Rickettsiales bacterium]|nr:hypothetical protein [Rickettsiales bacterium]
MTQPLVEQTLDLPLSATLPWRSVGGTIFGMPTAIRTTFSAEHLNEDALYYELREADIPFSSVPLADDKTKRNVMIAGDVNIRLMLAAGATIDAEVEKLVSQLLV